MHIEKSSKLGFTQNIQWVRLHRAARTHSLNSPLVRNRADKNKIKMMMTMMIWKIMIKMQVTHITNVVCKIKWKNKTKKKNGGHIHVTHADK